MKKNFFYNFILTTSTLLFPLLTFPYLSRVLGADGLGICNFITSYVQNFTIIAALGIPVYGIREISKAGDDIGRRSKLFFELLSIHLVFTLFLLVFYFTSIIVLGELTKYKSLALLGSLLIFFNVFSIQWLFAGLSTFKYITIRSLLIKALSVIAIFAFVRDSDDLFIYILIIVITSLVSVAIDLYYAKKFISRNINLTKKGFISHLKPIFLLGTYMVLTSIYSILPTTLLGFLGTKQSVGYYYGANRIIALVISAFNALTTVMVPRLNLAIEKSDKTEYNDLISKALSVVIAFGIPVSAFIFFLAKPIVLILAGNDFYNSIAVIQIMSPIILIVAFAQVFVLHILSVHRKDKQLVLLSIVGMSCSLIVNVIFIPTFAELATGFSQLGSELLVTVISFVMARKVLKLTFPVKDFFLNFVCTIPIIIIIYVLTALVDNHFAVIFLSAVSCTLYFLFYQFTLIKNPNILILAEPFLLRFSIKKV